MFRQLLSQNGRLHVAVRPHPAKKLNNTLGADILRVHFIDHAANGTTPGRDPHQVFRADAGFHIVRRRTANGMLYLRIAGVFSHIHHNCLTDAILLLNGLFQRHKNIGGLHHGNFHQPFFLTARQCA